MKKIFLILAAAVVLSSCASCKKKDAEAQVSAEKLQREAEMERVVAFCDSACATMTDGEKKAVYEDCYLKTPIAEDGESAFFCEYTNDRFYICCDTSKEYHTENPRLVAGFKDYHEESRAVKFGVPKRLDADGPYGEGNPPAPAPYWATDSFGTDIIFIETLRAVFDDGSEYQFTDGEIGKIKRAYALVANRLR